MYLNIKDYFKKKNTYDKFIISKDGEEAKELHKA